MEGQSSSKINYTALDAMRREIRLLTVKPSITSDSQVEWLLETAFLDDNIEFLALSYAWGDAKVTQDIIVNGFEVPVTKNLAAALQQLLSHWTTSRFPLHEPPYRLWVDALCINQDDISERSSQVQIMGDIYRRAQKVISWLGVEADRSRLAMAEMWNIFRSIASLSKEDDKFSWLERYPALTSIKPGQPSAWYDIHSLWTRDYWSRVWILQETVLGKDILLMCGAAPIIPWICVLTIHNWAASIKSTDLRPSFITEMDWRHFTGRAIFDAQPVMRAEMLRQMWHQDNRMTAVKDIGFIPLSLGRELRATNPRDKVFGLLGVMDVDIIPDYSISVRNLYVKTASKYLRQSGLRRVLNAAGRVQLNPYDLPTWVPDWSREIRQMPFLAQLSAAEISTSKSVSFRAEGSILTVEGVCLSLVQELEPDAIISQNSLDNNSSRAWQISKRYQERFGDRLYTTGIPPLQAVMRLLIGDEDFLNDGAKLEIPSDKFFTLGSRFVGSLCASGDHTNLDFDDRCKKNLPKLGLAADENFAMTFSKRFVGADTPLGHWHSSQAALYGDFSAYLRVESHLGKFLPGNRVFHTENGYLGIGPETIQPGDLLYGLKECILPVILRRVRSHYALIGTCIVQGLMQGELGIQIDRELNLEQIEIH